MFEKKKKTNKVEESVKEESKQLEEQKEEIIDKNVPNPRVAIEVVRSAIIHHVLCICNIDKQERHDVATCVDYLLDYLTEPVEFRISDSLQEQINKKKLDNYSKSYTDNEYKITLTITKKEGK